MEILVFLWLIVGAVLVGLGFSIKALLKLIDKRLVRLGDTLQRLEEKEDALHAQAAGAEAPLEPESGDVPASAGVMEEVHAAGNRTSQDSGPITSGAVVDSVDGGAVPGGDGLAGDAAAGTEQACRMALDGEDVLVEEEGQTADGGMRGDEAVGAASVESSVADAAADDVAAVAHEFDESMEIAEGDSAVFEDDEDAASAAALHIYSPSLGVAEEPGRQKEQLAAAPDTFFFQVVAERLAGLVKRKIRIFDEEGAGSAEGKRSHVEGLVRSLITFFKAGNIWVSGGVLMLLLGFGFLVSFMSDQGVLSLELRIAIAAAGGIAMIGFGIFLRLKKPVYAMVMQGGGIGVVYLAVFAAAKLTSLLSPLAALVLMCFLTVPAVGLALLQNSQVLAVFGFAGGFAAPVLLSSGSNEYVLLFAYYTLLDLGMLGICRFKLWRWLNLLGAGCSFGVMGGWGLLSYETAMFVSVEPFLLGFTAIFLLITLISVQKQDFSFSNSPDIALALGVPFSAVVFQWTIVQELPHGLSLSALLFGAFFTLLAMGMRRWWREKNNRLAEVYLAGGILLMALAVPLEFSGAVTSGIWAAQGALTFFFGCRYRAVFVRKAGLGLQFAALGALVVDPALWGMEDRHFLLESLLLAWSFLSTAYFRKLYLEQGGDSESPKPSRLEALLLRALPSWFSLDKALVWGGLFWHFTGLFLEFVYFSENPVVYFFLAASLSALVFSFAAKLLEFPELFPAINIPLFFSPVVIFLPVFTPSFFRLRLLSPEGIADMLGYHPYLLGVEGIAWSAFALAVIASLLLVKREKDDLVQNVLVVLPVLGILFALSCTLRFFTFFSLELTSAWVSFSGTLPSLIALCVIAFCMQKERIAEVYMRPLVKVVPFFLFSFLGIWLLLGVFEPGHLAPVPFYIPILNPLELQQMLCIAVCVLWFCLCKPLTPAFLFRTSLLVFIWLHSVIIRTAHYYSDVPFGESVWNIELFQLLLTSLWGVCGAAAIIGGHKKKIRLVWILGVSLIVLDTIKLFTKDLSDKSTMFHIASFFLVGGIFLLIGLLAPLPPEKKVESGEGLERTHDDGLEPGEGDSADPADSESFEVAEDSAVHNREVRWEQL